MLGNGLQQRQRARCLSMSEIMTILISFHQNQYRDFKHFHEKKVCKYWRKEFPRLPSSNRFVEFMGSAMRQLCIYLKHCFGECTGIS
ncbi:MAG: IS982 family transposase, partial [Pseudanabaena sp.]